ncbi:MAG: serine/threonine protein kinase [Proteobacteria bacterium]|nr:serine/threonine protein kinase [Pseudomonadota bacterium]
MAQVFRARHMGTAGWGKAVALKRLWGDDEIDLTALPATANCLKSLINEAELGSRLSHPNIVAVHDFDSVQGRFYLAMELVPGWTLEEILKVCRMRGVALPPPAAVEIALAVARALEYAHALADDEGRPLELVHRDLKPANILIGRDGSIKVSNFGIAKAASNVYATMGTKMIKGTPRYMSPEQALGQRVDRRSDLFSLGTLLAEMILNRPMWDAGSLLGVFVAVAEVAPAGGG